MKTTYTHITTEGMSNRRLANATLKALERLEGCKQGTIRRPYEGASTVLEDRRTIIETIYEDGGVLYNDGYLIIEVDGHYLYVAYSTRALKEYGITEETEFTNIEDTH